MTKRNWEGKGSFHLHFSNSLPWKHLGWKLKKGRNLEPRAGAGRGHGGVLLVELLNPGPPAQWWSASPLTSIIKRKSYRFTYSHSMEACSQLVLPPLSDVLACVKLIKKERKGKERKETNKNHLANTK